MTNKELDEVVFNEILSDFASLIQEQGAKDVATRFIDSFPTQARQVYQHMNFGAGAAQTAALFKP